MATLPKRPSKTSSKRPSKTSSKPPSKTSSKRSRKKSRRARSKPRDEAVVSCGKSTRTREYHLSLVDNLVDPAHFDLDEAVASSGESTREYRAIQRHYSTIVDNLGKTVDPARFARRLREKSLIGDSIVAKASLVGVLTGSERISPAIDAVLAQIKLKANIFHEFMRILETENLHLADTIIKYYDSSLEQHISDDVEPQATSSEGFVNVVAKEAEKLERCFANLTLCLQTEVEENETPVMKFQHSITHLPLKIRKEHSTFIKNSVKELSSAENIKELFIHLNVYWNFFDCSLLEHFIEIHGSEGLKEELKKYTEDLKFFRKKTTVEQLLKEYPDGFRSQKPSRNFSKFTSKLNRKTSECTLEELEQFRRHFCSKFSLPTFAVMLATCKEGSITIVWYMPSSEVHFIHNTSIKWNEISADLLQFEAEGIFKFEFASECSVQALEKYTALTHLHLGSQWISADDIALLSSALRGRSLLQHLDLSGNKFGSRGAEYLANQILKKNRVLTHLDLSECEIDADGVALLSSSLGNKLYLQYLDLSANKFDLKATECLAQALAEHTALIHLDLSLCDVTADGTAFLSSLLKNNSCIQHLNLSANKFGSKGAKYLAQALTENTALTYLDLSWCDIGSDGIALFSSSLKNKPHIQYLDLSENTFDSRKKEYLFRGKFEQERQDQEFTGNLLSSNPSESDGASPPGEFQHDQELIKFLSNLPSSSSLESDGTFPPGAEVCSPIHTEKLQQERQDHEFTSNLPSMGNPSESDGASPPGDIELERQDQELIELERENHEPSTIEQERQDHEPPLCRHWCTFKRFCYFMGGGGVLLGLVIAMVCLITAVTLPSTTTNQETELIYEEEAALLAQLNPTIQSANISETVSTDVHIISLYSVNCDLLNYTSEPIADALNANYSGGSIVPIQEFSYYASGSLVNLSISVLCYHMLCSGLSYVSFVFFTDYNEHLSFQNGSPLESLDYYTVEDTQLLSHPSLVSVPINSTGYYFVDLILPKEDSLTYTVILSITGTRSYLNVTKYDKYLFCTLSSSTTSCTFERPLDNSIYCILAYVLGQPPSSETDRFANITSVLVTDSPAARIWVGTLIAIFLCILTIIISGTAIYLIMYYNIQ